MLIYSAKRAGKHNDPFYAEPLGGDPEGGSCRD